MYSLPTCLMIPRCKTGAGWVIILNTRVKQTRRCEYRDCSKSKITINDGSAELGIEGIVSDSWRPLEADLSDELE